MVRMDDSLQHSATEAATHRPMRTEISGPHDGPPTAEGAVYNSRVLSDADLLARVLNFEDSFTERKPSRDSRDWKKTLVAFANSAPIGFPAVLFIGVRPDGYNLSKHIADNI